MVSYCVMENIDGKKKDEKEKEPPKVSSSNRPLQEAILDALISKTKKKK